MPPAVYLLSKRLDPLFMLFIGTSATWIRIRRDNPQETAAETFETVKRRLGRVDWRGFLRRQLPWNTEEIDLRHQFGRAEPPNSRRGPGVGEL